MSGTTQQLTSSGRFDAPSDLIAVPAEPTPKPRLQKGMTHKKLCQRIRLGHGMGHGSGYLPWLILRRNNPSPYSNQVATSMPPLRRGAYYYSRGEYHTALLLLWLGVRDLREQFPLWPIAHPHPLDGTPGTAPIQRPWSRGLLDIAREAGIDHGYEIGPGVPYVASLDLLATAPLPGGDRLAGFSSKPIVDPTQEVDWRTLERLELERRYTAAIDCPYFVSSSALIPKLMAGQLEVWLDASTLYCAPHLITWAGKFAHYLNASLDLPINEAVLHAARTLRLTTAEAWLLFQHCAWTQSIDIDPSRRILTSYPVRPGGRPCETTCAGAFSEIHGHDGNDHRAGTGACRDFGQFASSWSVSCAGSGFVPGSSHTHPDSEYRPGHAGQEAKKLLRQGIFFKKAIPVEILA